MEKIGITERGDPSYNRMWMNWVRQDKPAILITKRPSILYEILNSHFVNPNVIIHCTITGYSGTKIEPNTPSVENSIEGLFNLVNFLGPERIVLRIDPIIPTIKGIARAKQVLEKVLALWNIEYPKLRVRISFLDNYPHVKERFIQAGLPTLPYEFHSLLSDRKSCIKDLNYPTIEICGEPDMSCTGCISDLDCQILQVKPVEIDSLQRPTCCCLGQKQELLTKKQRCPVGCLYCYWKD